ncbi:hypothetical protein NESM_000879000 [Novymonas esmeraldas]|uniref:Uncharacterized protein n=1 Tax=Novymonas esmeraldas TaxID=1808958 RepID=A0AAW0F1A1_9TRYP
MLDPVAADLVDAIARLCVLRTEDHTLLLTAHARTQDRGSHQRQQETLRGAPAASAEAGGHPVRAEEVTNHEYMRYLTDEVRGREQQRLAEEQRWLSAVREWAGNYTAACASSSDTQRGHEEQSGGGAAATSAIGSLWAAMSSSGGGSAFHRVYAAAVQQSYELESSDLANSPFAHTDGSMHLYKSGIDAAGPVRRVQSLFFASVAASPSPSRVLADVHPLIAGDPSDVSEASRSRLRASRHIWNVLFFLWCHVTAADSTAPAASVPTAAGRDAAEHCWLCCEAALVGPARDFLAGQSRQLHSLMEKVRAVT